MPLEIPRQHDDEGDHDADDDPQVVGAAGGEGHLDGLRQAVRLGGHSAEGAADDVHVGAHGSELAGDGHLSVGKHPAHDHGVADGQAQGADHGDAAQPLADLLGVAAVLHSLTKGAGGAAAGPTAQRELLHHAGLADDEGKDRIGDQEGQAAISGDQHGEAPHVSHTHAGTHSGHDKAKLRLKAVLFL